MIASYKDQPFHSDNAGFLQFSQSRWTESQVLEVYVLIIISHRPACPFCSCRRFRHFMLGAAERNFPVKRVFDCFKHAPGPLWFLRLSGILSGIMECSEPPQAGGRW
jgi:hypothetical protein